MVNSAFRQFLLIMVIAFAAGAIAALAFGGLLDPNGPVGPGGIVVSFCCSLVALVAVIGLSRGHTAVRLFDEEPEEVGEFEEDEESSSSTSGGALFSNGAFAAFATAYFTVMISFLFGLLRLRGTVVFPIVIAVIAIIPAVVCIIAASLAVAKREPRRGIALVCALMSVPIIVWAGYLLRLALISLSFRVA